jgi:histidinol-phosphate phosphatase family protein
MTNLKKAIFLDRDGVLNKERKDYVKNILELEIFSNIVIPIRKLKDDGFLIVVITNQSAINRGVTTIKNVKEIHQHIQNYLKKFDLEIDGFFICPHRPDENCLCRKPKSGLLLEAIKEFKIDVNFSWMIGDNDSDIIAARSIGCKAIKVGDKLNLNQAVEKILINL